MVPNGWKLSNFKDLNIVTVDGDRGKNYPKKDEYLQDGHCLFLGADNIKNGNIDLYSKIFLTKQRHEALSKGVVDYDDLILVMRGNGTGRIGLYSKEASPYSIARINSGLVIIRIDQNKLDKYFALQLMKSEVIIKQFESYMFGSAQPQLTIKILKSLSLPTPPLKEQQKIAKILSTWDKAISTTERLIDNSTQQKKGLMQQLLTGKKRLLDESGKQFEGEWERLKLADIVIKTQLGTSERTKDVEETSTIPLIKMGNLTWGGFSFDKLETLPKSKVDESLILKSGDFLFNTRNTPELVGKSAVWKEQQVEATFDNNINRITFNQNIDTDFMCLYLTYGKGKSLISSLSAGSTSVAAIYWKDLKNIQLPVPTLSEQQKIATVLTNADKEIALLEQQLADLQQEKKALMQVLLTGKKRVNIN